jgi:hypothetical protein
MERQAERDAKTAEAVNTILGQADRLGIKTTRRQARKMLQGRGSLRAQIEERVS